jgi:hypothetical protein
VLKIKKLKNLKNSKIINHQKKSETALQLPILMLIHRNSNPMLDKISSLLALQSHRVKPIEEPLRDILEKEKETKRSPKRSHR